MKVFQLNEDLEWNQKGENGHAEPLVVSNTGRVLRFTFRPGQYIPMADAPSSPFFFVVIRGQAIFKDASGRETAYGPNTLVTFEPGEDLALRAGNDDLIVLAVMRETHLERTESARPGSAT